MKIRVLYAYSLIFFSLLNFELVKAQESTEEIDVTECYSRALGKYDNDFQKFEESQALVLACLNARVETMLFCESTMFPDIAAVVYMARKVNDNREFLYLPSYHARFSYEGNVIEEFELEDNWGHGALFYIEDIKDSNQKLLLGDVYLIRRIDDRGSKYQFLGVHMNWVITNNPDDVFNNNITELNDIESARRGSGSFVIDRETGFYAITERNALEESGFKNLDEGICDARKNSFSNLWSVLTSIAKLTKSNIRAEIEERDNKLKF